MEQQLSRHRNSNNILLSFSRYIKQNLGGHDDFSPQTDDFSSGKKVSRYV